jgi:hypothetical protein
MVGYQNRYALEREKCVLQDFEPLALQMRVRHRQTCSARAGQAIDDSVANGIVVDRRHDRNFWCAPPAPLRTGSDNYIEVALREFARQLAQTVQKRAAEAELRVTDLEKVRSTQH